MVVSFDHLSLQHLQFWKTKEVTWCQLWQAGNLWNTSHTEHVHCPHGETSQLSSVFHLAFTTHFPSDAVTFQCNNASLQFVLENKFVTNVQVNIKRQWAFSSHLSKLVLSFRDTDMMDSSTETYLVSASYPSTCLSSPVIISEWNSGVSLKHGTCWQDLPTSHSIRGTVPRHFRFVFQMLRSGTKCNSQNVSSVQFSTWQ